ncbi:MAG: Asp-tRNA(Asn)/Glu-tRNA(Gln) amidotransferase subunit GatB [Verrucomicrobia bacterium]|nr:MAG: Asp-tRNA(Asn)/Glu-tRNA(Gln) amidotransferase subunit GatB [Verrucomicrobiota bacterium]
MSSQNLDVPYVAHLARIALSEEEMATFQPQLGRVLEYVEQLKAVDVSHVEPTAHAMPVYNVFRQDEPQSGLSKAEALENAPRTANGLFVVTKVME